MPSRIPKLSPRETEILCMIAAGYRNPQLAERLHIAPGTVTTHVAHILQKLEVPTRAMAVALACREGLLEAKWPVIHAYMNER